MRTTWNCCLLALLALLTLSCGPSESTAPTAPTANLEPPNILLIVADDLGYGDLGSYGQTQIQTPRLDELARQGVRFTNFYAGSTVCAPSRAALMAGLHTGHVPIRGNRSVPPMGQHPLDAAVVTFAEILQGQGYYTGLIGKWGLGGPGSPGEPNSQGFDHFFGYLDQTHAHNYYPEFLFRNRERVPLRNELPEPKRPNGAGVATKKVDYSHDLIAEEAIGFVESNKDRRFLLVLTPTIPHANNEARAEGMEVPDYGAYAGKDWPAPMKGHAAMITRLDESIGRLLDKLDEHGIADNTLVLFTSDNGPHREGGFDPDFNDSNGPLRGIKRDLYEGGIRVPLLARWPGKLSAGSTNDHVGAFWDFLATFAKLAGASSSPDTDGISMAPTLSGDAAGQQNHEFLYWEFHEGEASKQAVRMGEWKGVRLAPNAALELYKLDEDIAEERNVAADHPDVVKKIEDYLATARTESELWPLRVPQ
jgi:arylsulfatase A-like enzyme